MANPLQPEATDEALGFRTLATLLDGDLDRATTALTAARLPGRSCALFAGVVPSAALRLVWRLASRPSARHPAAGG